MAYPAAMARLFKLELHSSTPEVHLYRILRYHDLRSGGGKWQTIKGEWTKPNAIGHVLQLLRDRLADLFALEDSAVLDGPHIRMAQETVSTEIERWEECQRQA